LLSGGLSKDNAGCNTGRNLPKEVVTNMLHCESVRVFSIGVFFRQIATG
jgi:hypothetical protein